MNNPFPARPSLSHQIVLALLLVVAVVVLTGGFLGTRLSVVIGGGLAVVVGVWLDRRLTRPLKRLTQAAQEYAQGNVTQEQVHGGSVREVRELADTMQTMLRAVQTHIGSLTAERNQATAILESMAEGVIAFDPTGRIVLVNPMASTLLNLPAREVIHRSLFAMVRDPDIQDLARGVLRTRQRATKDLTLFQPTERVLRVHAVPCEGGGPTGPVALLVIQDITEHHRYEQLRKEFVANVSHELKSPLTSIRSLTETLLGGALDDAANNRRFVQLMDEDAARLSHLIDDLLALSQIESQAVPLTLSVVELKPLAESVLTSLQPGIAQRRLAVTLQVPPGLSVRADAERLRQVVLNLADNAVKYNREGGTMTLSAASDGTRATVTVADTGIGIPEPDLPRVFERFYRVDKARSRELGGTGLGLAIVKHIVEAHGGTVSVESRPNHGSRFSFSMPLAS